MPANWFDHVVASVAPRMAARRVLARQAFETLTRGYDGASKGRRTDGWRAPGSSADTEIGVAGALLRDRMRDLVRNIPHATKAVAVLVNNIAGSGIMPRAASGDDKLDRKVDALFTRWTADCDADGQLDFYGLQTLICREMVEAGEVLVPSAGQMPDLMWNDLREAAKKLNLATPSGRLVLAADETDFDWGETRISRFNPIIMMNAHTFASMRAPPHPVSGRLHYHFCDDLASGGIGDPTLSGRESSPVLNEILSNFHVGHVLRISVSREGK